MNAYQRIDPWVGRTLGEGDRYKITRLLNSGGMGRVYLAADARVNHQLVAVKILKETLSGMGEMHNRFKREVDLCASLNSINIVKISDRGVTPEGFPFYVMEYLQGQTLSELLQQRQPSTQESIDIVMQVCDALAVAHYGVSINGKQIKVVHRDLKPENLFLIPFGRGWLVKILDFGIAKRLHEGIGETPSLASGTSVFIGTYHYAAPEQIQVSPNIDHRADIYSLGLIFYKLLSGHDPFGLETSKNVPEFSWCRAHVSQPPQSLSDQEGCHHLPQSLINLVMKCLEKDPALRFSSVKEMKTVLEAIDLSAVSSLSPATETSVVEEVKALVNLEEVKVDLQPLPHTTVVEEVKPDPQAPPNITVVERAKPPDLQPLPHTTVVEEVKPDPQAPPNITVVEGAKPPDLQPLPHTTVVEEVKPKPQAPPNITVVEGAKSSDLQPPTKVTLIEEVKKPDPPVSAPQQPRIGNFYTQIMFQLAISGLVAIAAIAAVGIYFVITYNDRVLNSLNQLKQNRNYQECIRQAETINGDTKIYSKARAILNECRLDQAKILYNEGEEEDALEMLELILTEAASNRNESLTDNNFIGKEAERLKYEWTQL